MSGPPWKRLHTCTVEFHHSGEDVLTLVAPSGPTRGNCSLQYASKKPGRGTVSTQLSQSHRVGLEHSIGMSWCRKGLLTPSSSGRAVAKGCLYARLPPAGGSSYLRTSAMHKGGPCSTNHRHGSPPAWLPSSGTGAPPRIASDAAGGLTRGPPTRGPQLSPGPQQRRCTKHMHGVRWGRGSSLQGFGRGGNGCGG